MSYLPRILGEISSVNSTVLTSGGGTLLGASGSWTGGWVDVTQYGLASVRLEAGVEDFKGFSDINQFTMLKINEKSDIWAEGQRVTGSGTAKVRVDWNYILEKN